VFRGRGVVLEHEPKVSLYPERKKYYIQRGNMEEAGINTRESIENK
jgi:hypothetical protein